MIGNTRIGKILLFVCIGILWILLLFITRKQKYNIYKPKPYIIIVHEPTNAAYILSRDMKIHTIIVNVKDVDSIIKNHVFKKKGWLPRHDYQKPIWVLDKPSKEFTAYWMY